MISLKMYLTSVLDSSIIKNVNIYLIIFYLNNINIDLVLKKPFEILMLRKLDLNEIEEIFI
jgi:hypothetical protein